jgi:membrane associated rhomboid family serine protease
MIEEVKPEQPTTPAPSQENSSAQSNEPVPATAPRVHKRPRRVLKATVDRSGMYTTYVLIGLNLAYYCFSLVLGASMLMPEVTELVSAGANLGGLSAGPQPWRLITSTFLHVGIVHLAFNMLVLYTIGGSCEQLFGRLGYLTLYMLSGIGGSLGSILWDPIVVGAGASGAIFGLYGGILGLMMVKEDALPKEVLQRHTRNGLGFVVLNLLAGSAVPGVDMAAHLGGLFVGWICGCALSTGFKHGEPFNNRGIAPAMLVAVLLSGVFYFVNGRVARSPSAQAVAMLLQANMITLKSKSQIFYSGDATRADAERLIDALEELQFLTHDQQIAVWLSKHDQQIEVSMPVIVEKANSPEIREAFKALGEEIRKKAFPGSRLQLKLSTQYMVPVHSIDISAAE